MRYFSAIFLLLYPIGAFSRKRIIEKSVTLLVFCKPNKVETLRMGGL